MIQQKPSRKCTALNEENPNQKWKEELGDYRRFQGKFCTGFVLRVLLRDRFRSVPEREKARSEVQTEMNLKNLPSISWIEEEIRRRNLKRTSPKTWIVSFVSLTLLRRKMERERQRKWEGFILEEEWMRPGCTQVPSFDRHFAFSRTWMPPWLVSQLTRLVMVSKSVLMGWAELGLGVKFCTGGES